MNALTPARRLRIVEPAASEGSDVVVLGRDIRASASAEKIVDYCVTAHESIYEDLATIVESMAYADRLVVRRRATGWTRQLSIELPVYEHAHFRRPSVAMALADAAQFLTGDQWTIEFVARKRSRPPRQGKLPLRRGAIRHIVPFSDGLDSFAQAKLSVHSHGTESVMLVRSGLTPDSSIARLAALRVPRKFSGVRMREVSYRTRPLVFYTLAAIAAAVTEAEAVVIGESGQGAIGPACLPFADEWWFRSAHPAFVKRWAEFLGLALERPIRFEQPQLWQTKGEVLSSLRDRDLLEGWQRTRSCAARPNERHGHHGCGICGGCLLRRSSACAARLALPAGDHAFDIEASEDRVCDQGDREMRMTPGERGVAVRAIAVMAEFARLADAPEGKSVVDREARLINPSDPRAAEARLLRLLKQHKAEWDALLLLLPSPSWVRDIMGQL
jgi:7-cyano-7-deazaguanine synthase in queuosine biosynthesis